MSRETYSGVEVTHLFTGANEPTLPHLYSCTQQLRLLRMMLVREDGDTSGSARPSRGRGLRPGETIDIRNAPTAFGPVSFKIESHLDRGRITVDWRSPTRRAPGVVFIRLRHPAGRAISALTINGKQSRSFSGETVRLESPTGKIKIEAAF